MSNKKLRQETISTIDIMIKEAEKGVSGFWVDDEDACGNPDIFPEFAEAMGKRLLMKKHEYCPWNIAIVFGEGYGNLSTGCFHSCSIREMKYLSPELIRTILRRFKKNLQNGVYDNAEHLKPLLTKEELAYIEKQKKLEAKRFEDNRQSELAKNKKKAASLIAKYKNDEDVVKFILANYGSNTVCLCEEGTIDFSFSRIKEIEGGENLTYNDYLDIQLMTRGKKIRDWFEKCYYEIPSEFKGEVEKISQDGKYICFKRVFVEGMYRCDLTFWNGKEEHVWMDIDGFEDYKVGDCVSFFADVYRYVKKSNGKQLDYGLRNPKGIKKIEVYSLPTDKEIMAQTMQIIVCETCYLNEQCNKTYCIVRR